MKLVEDRWPSKKNKVPSQCLPFWNFRDQISFCDRILFKGEKIIIPRSMQPEMLKIIHSSHLGIEKCKHRARDIMYWPGMTTQNEGFVSSCGVCSTYCKSNTKEPLLPHSIPSRPWSQVGSDLFDLHGKQYLILVDYHSGFIEIDLLHGTTSNQIITHCKSQFTRHGILDTFISDNGPQFSSFAFKQFAQQYQVEQLQYWSILPNIKWNGRKIGPNHKGSTIHDDRDLYLALLEYRNTPQSDAMARQLSNLWGGEQKHSYLPQITYCNPKQSVPRW